MSERVDFREPTQETDNPVIGAFGGLSSATTSASGNITHQQKLINAFVNKKNEITRRQGSSIVASVANLSAANADLTSAHFFTFDDINYAVVREGNNLRLLVFDTSGFSVDSKLKTNVFNSSAPVEKTTFSTVIEDRKCFVLCASKSTPLTVLCLLKRDVTLQTQPAANIITVNVNNYPSGDVVNSNKLLLFNESNVNAVVTNVTQADFLHTITTASPFSVPAGARFKVHLCFVCQCTSATYYPGFYMYNAAVRRNLIPLDVNVQVPAELSDNPLLTEIETQDLAIATITAYKTNAASATQYTRVTNRQPTTADQWDFSDGSYVVNPSLFTVRSPAYIAFGGLQTPPDESRVYLFRARSMDTLLAGYFVNRSRARVYVDKVQYANTQYLASNGALVTDDTVSVKYMSLATNVSPGINISAVVELIYFNQGLNNLVDLSTNTPAIFIDDGFAIPLYGSSAFSNYGANVYPELVQTVGNRVVISGLSNRLAVSSSDWEYRGISWNNFQVSTINFSETSAYLVSLTQSTSIVKAVTSVNGVLIIGTDSGIYRVSGASANAPPNATSANVSRISNEVVQGQSSMIVYSNRVFYVSRNGLYAVEFSRDNEEVNATPLSQHVSNYFTDYTAEAITYSSLYRAFVISFLGTNELLVYFLESESFAVFKIAANSTNRVLSTLDGYMSVINTTGTDRHVLFSRWNTTTADFTNASTALPPLSNLLGRSQTYTEVPQENTIVTPVELLPALNPSLVQSYGKERVRAVGGSVAVVENAGVNTPAPIISAMVTKGFSQAKLIASVRARAFNLLINGSGNIKATVVCLGTDYSDRIPDIQQFAIDSSSGYNGESLLNYQYVNEQSSVGDYLNIRIRTQGITEAFELALLFDGTLSILGYMPDTSSKRRGKLR